MGWSVVLEDENKNEIKLLNGEIYFSQEELSKTILLKYLDLFGNTIFNCNQMEDLVKDLNSIKNINKREKDVIIGFANSCKNGSHLYVVFYGD